MKKVTQWLAPIALASVVAIPACAQVPAAENDERTEAREAHRAVWVEHIHEGGERPSRPPRPEAPHIAQRVELIRSEALQEQFSEFDLDNDGYVNVNELTEVMERQARERAERLFNRLDKDGTGMLDQEAFAANIRGFRVIEREEVRAQMERARAMHDEVERRMEIIIHDEDGQRVIEERHFGPLPDGEYEIIIEEDIEEEVEERTEGNEQHEETEVGERNG